MELKFTLVILFFSCILLTHAQSAVDELVIPSDTSGFPVVFGLERVTRTEAVVDSSILGGERDLIVTGVDGTSNSCQSESFVNDGWFLVSGSDCSADMTLQYDGVDGGSEVNAHGLGNINLFTFGNGFTLRTRTDLETTFRMTIFSGASQSSQVSRILQGNEQEQTLTFDYTEFSGNVNFESVTAIELVVLAPTNCDGVSASSACSTARDTFVNFLEFTSSTIAGRVFSDCNCNNVLDASDDSPAQGVTVTATPGSGCLTSQVLSAVTDASGDYLIQNTEQCTYTVAVSGNSCSGSRSISVGNDAANAVNFGLQVAGSLSIPANVQVGCNDCTTASSQCTGVATASNSCGGSGSGSVTNTDSIVPQDNCPNNFNINRQWCINDAQTGQFCETQVISVRDNGGNPTITAPADVSIACEASSDPSNTGNPSTSDDCTANLIVNFSDDVSVGSCDPVTCGQTGTIIRTWTVDDQCGGSDSAVQTISRQPCTGVIVECTPIIIQPSDCPTATPDLCPEDDDDFSVAQDDDDDAGEDDEDGSSSSASTLTLSFTLLLAIIAFFF